MIVRFDLHQYMNGLFDIGEFAVIGRGHQARTSPTLDDGGVVTVCGYHTIGCLFGGRLDHAEQSLLLSSAIDDPTGIEYFVATMLGICLSKHHQLSIRRVTVKIRVAGYQIVNFIRAQRQTQLGVCSNQRIAAIFFKRDRDHRGRAMFFKQRLNTFRLGKNRFRHTIEKLCRNSHKIVVADLAGELDGVANASLNAIDRIDIASVGNVSCFRRPGRDGAWPWHDEQLFCALRQLERRVAGQQQCI